LLYVVIAKDGTDADAPARRAAVRTAHLETAKELLADGRLVTGGALLDEDGNMIGSMLLLDVPDEKAARDLMEADVYTRSGVWQDLQIWPYRKAL